MIASAISRCHGHSFTGPGSATVSGSTMLRSIQRESVCGLFAARRAIKTILARGGGINARSGVGKVRFLPGYLT